MLTAKMVLRSGDVEDEFGRRSFGIVVERRTLAHEVVLVNVAGLCGVGL